jgi:hypothetical protein
MMATQFHLSEWLPWSRRDSVPDDPGVYLISKAETKNIIYIGKTWGGEGLRKRLRHFGRAACGGVKGHSGGLTYNRKFGKEVTDLLIAVHISKVVRTEPEILNAYILFAERSLIWQYVELNGRLPICNTE